MTNFLSHFTPIIACRHTICFTFNLIHEQFIPFGVTFGLKYFPFFLSNQRVSMSSFLAFALKSVVAFPVFYSFSESTNLKVIIRCVL
jgi:hypothetical protein